MLLGGAELPVLIRPTVWAVAIPSLIVVGKIISDPATREFVTHPKLEDVILIALIAWIWISTLSNGISQVSFEYLLRVSLLVVTPYLIIRVLVRKYSDIHLVLITISFVGSFAGIVTTVLWIIDGQFYVANTEINRASFFDTNPVPTSVILLLGGAASLSLFYVRRQWPHRYVLMLTIASMQGLFLTGSRGPLLAVMLMLGIAILVQARHRNYRMSAIIRSVSLAALSLVLVVAVLGGSLLKSNSETPFEYPRQYLFPTVGRFSHVLIGTYADHQYSEAQTDQSTNHRLSTWKDSFKKFPTGKAAVGFVLAVLALVVVYFAIVLLRFLRGPIRVAGSAIVGGSLLVTGYLVVSSVNLTFGTSMYRTLFGEGSGTLETSTHNIFVEIATGNGLVGLLIIGSFFALIWLRGLADLNKKLSHTAFALFILFSGSFLIRQFSFTMLGNRDLFICEGLLVAAMYIARAGKSSTTSHENPSPDHLSE